MDVACITVRQVKGKEVRLLFNPADHNQRFAKVRLPMPWGMAQRNKHLDDAAWPRRYSPSQSRPCENSGGGGDGGLGHHDLPRSHVVRRFGAGSPAEEAPGLRGSMWGA